MWKVPKLDWTPDDYYNFDDLNRVENNTEIIAELLPFFGANIDIATDTNRDLTSIEFADSLNRIEGNLAELATRYKPPGWIESKLDWQENASFDYRDAQRLERNLALLYAYYKGNVDNFRYCGAHTCGGGVI